MKVIVLGQGGREHALVWRLRRCASVDHVYVAPGNGGTAALPGVTNLRGLDGYDRLAQRAEELGVGLVVPGPEHVIVDGVQAFFKERGIPCFCPSKAAAELEGSKAYAKAFMARHAIPTARYEHFESHPAARAYLDAAEDDVVIKADGPAGGQGVALPRGREEARRALRALMPDGAASGSVVVEERLAGPEISVLTLADGASFRTLPPAQDHRGVADGGRGPGTGGMGAYAPVPFVSAAQMREIDDVIIRPTLEGMRAEGRAFLGVLLTGIVLTPAGPKVLGYNVRFGDPVAQTLLPLLEGDLARLLLACVHGRLAGETVAIAPGYACNIVVAAAGYPGPSRAGEIITIHDRVDSEDVHVFHAGTELADDGVLRTRGGRVLGVAARGDSLEDAVRRAYRGVAAVSFDGMFYRRDIASEALARWPQEDA